MSSHRIKVAYQFYPSKDITTGEIDGYVTKNDEVCAIVLSKTNDKLYLDVVPIRYLKIITEEQFNNVRSI